MYYSGLRVSLKKYNISRSESPGYLVIGSMYSQINLTIRSPGSRVFKLGPYAAKPQGGVVGPRDSRVMAKTARSVVKPGKVANWLAVVDWSTISDPEQNLVQS